MGATSAHDLFSVDPAEFVSARDELARELKARGDTQEAAAVRAFRRPPVPIWALNHVARDRQPLIDSLLDTEAHARSAQQEVMEGNADREVLRAALAQRRSALNDVVHRAGEVIEQSGRPAQQRQVESVLNSVLASDRLMELLRRGELVDVADDDGEDDLASLLGASVSHHPTAKANRSQKAPEVSASKQVVDAQHEVEQHEAEASAKDDELSAAQQAAVDADNAVEQAREALRDVEQKAKDARRAERDAERASKKSADALERAEDTLRKLQS